MINTCDEKLHKKLTKCMAQKVSEPQMNTNLVFPISNQISQRSTVFKTKQQLIRCCYIAVYVYLNTQLTELNPSCVNNKHIHLLPWK